MRTGARERGRSRRGPPSPIPPSTRCQDRTSSSARARVMPPPARRSADHALAAATADNPPYVISAAKHLSRREIRPSRALVYGPTTAFLAVGEVRD